jgi:aspartate-semialdehyde dehydrogenase
MKKDEIRALEELYATYECPVVSNNSAHRMTPDVPMVIPEINPEQFDRHSRRSENDSDFPRTDRVKSNCSLQAMSPLIRCAPLFCRKS